jgi:hypothetical protein
VPQKERSKDQVPVVLLTSASNFSKERRKDQVLVVLLTSARNFSNVALRPLLVNKYHKEGHIYLFHGIGSLSLLVWRLECRPFATLIHQIESLRPFPVGGQNLLPVEISESISSTSISQGLAFPQNYSCSQSYPTAIFALTVARQSNSIADCPNRSMESTLNNDFTT